MRWPAYDTDGFYDEMFDAEGRPRLGAAPLLERIEELEEGELMSRQRAAEQSFWELGITFNVYGNEEGAERIFPFDIIPRIVSAQDWAVVESGLKQRIRVLNLFINDVYHDNSSDSFSEG